ncbi:hypothetical protein BDQ17DRAFT_919797 [Cyathus striatus]|nr:hypothetical protein BDQ17DRAFT_919797 [Cyathus striatus]
MNTLNDVKYDPLRVQNPPLRLRSSNTSPSPVTPGNRSNNLEYIPSPLTPLAALRSRGEEGLSNGLSPLLLKEDTLNPNHEGPLVSDSSYGLAMDALETCFRDFANWKFPSAVNSSHQMEAFPQTPQNPLLTPGSSAGSLCNNYSPASLHLILSAPIKSYIWNWDMSIDPRERIDMKGPIATQPAIPHSPQDAILRINFKSQLSVVQWLLELWGPIETKPDYIGCILKDMYQHFQQPLEAGEIRLWKHLRSEYLRSGDDSLLKEYFEGVQELSVGSKRIDVILPSARTFLGLRTISRSFDICELELEL